MLTFLQEWLIAMAAAILILLISVGAYGVSHVARNMPKGPAITTVVMFFGITFIVAALINIVTRT